MPADAVGVVDRVAQAVADLVVEDVGELVAVGARRGCGGLIRARLGEDAQIPASERFSTASCACLLLLQAAQAEGYGAQWLTGWPAYDREFLEGTLGLAGDEQLVGTIAIGTPAVEVPERDRPDAAALLADWHP